ncbi:MAG: potassium/proton antiporter [Oligoflexia bacterium]|nr:potassium/proton antiporter [Oligoflexia bacterium]
MNNILIILSILMILSVLSSKVSHRYGFPSLILFLGIGMMAGSDGIGGIHFANYALSQNVGIIALVFILFSGGLETEWDEIRNQIFSGLSLSTIGVLISTVIVGLFATYFLGLTWVQGLLLGAIVSPTDAAAVFMILRSGNLSVKKNLKSIVELESGSNDPICVFLVINLIEIIKLNTFSEVHILLLFLQQMCLGILLGIFFASFSRYLLNKVHLESTGLYPVLTIGIVLLNFSLCEEIGGNGFLSVYINGLIIAKNKLPIKDHLSFFHEGIAWNMQVVMFITFGLLVNPNQVIAITDKGTYTALILLFVARPVSVFISLHKSKLSFLDKMMIAWMGLRGAIPIVLATYPIIAKVENGHLIFNIVFFVVISSVLLQGTTIHLLGKIFLKK